MLSGSTAVRGWRELGLRVEGAAMLAADTLNKQLRTPKKGWLSSLGVGMSQQLRAVKDYHAMKRYTGPRTELILL
jgi:hypothetical protein